MAKTGFDFYPVDTDRYQDIRLKKLKRHNGCDGIAVYDYILCEIYRDKGYFLAWGEDSAFDVAEYFGIKETKVRGIVDFCASVGLFDKVLLGLGVLTSAAIQRRYFEMCARSRRKPGAIIPEYDLLNKCGENEIFAEEMAKTPQSCGENDVFAEEMAKNAEEMAKTPQKCNKVKESKIYNSQKSACAHEDVIQNSPLVHQLLHNEQWIEIVCMQHHLRPPDVKEWLGCFALHSQCSGVKHCNQRDVMSHFNAWLEKKLKEENNTIAHERKTGRRVITPGEIKDYDSSF